jgi:radical SAM protein with 4Fe4S-binding SPASM domain
MTGRALENLFVEITPKQYTQFLKNMFKIYLASEPSIQIRDFDELIDAAILKKPLPVCAYSGGCGQGNTWGFDWNGDVYPCNRGVGLDFFKFGNVKECKDLSELMKSPAFQRLSNREAQIKKSKKCGTCALGKDGVCAKTGGCEYTTYVNKKTLFSHDILCEEMESFYRWVKKELMKFDNGWVNDFRRFVEKSHK